MFLSYDKTNNIKWIKMKIINTNKLLFIEESKVCFPPSILSYLELSLIRSSQKNIKLSRYTHIVITFYQIK